MGEWEVAFTPETPPKWRLLFEVLEEARELISKTARSKKRSNSIQHKGIKGKIDDRSGCIVVFTKDEASTMTLRRLLSTSSKGFLATVGSRYLRRIWEKSREKMGRSRGKESRDRAPLVSVDPQENAAMDNPPPKTADPRAVESWLLTELSMTEVKEDRLRMWREAVEEPSQSEPKDGDSRRSTEVLPSRDSSTEPSRVEGTVPDHDEQVLPLTKAETAASLGPTRVKKRKNALEGDKSKEPVAEDVSRQEASTLRRVRKKGDVGEDEKSISAAARKKGTRTRDSSSTQPTLGTLMPLHSLSTHAGELKEG